MPLSMTGYATSKHQDDSCEVVCEIKSVNHRFLELSIKPNDINNKLDSFIRNTLKKRVERGAIDIRFKYNLSQAYSYSVNKESLLNLKKILSQLTIVNSQNISLSDIKNFPGIFETNEKNKIPETVIKKTFLEALDEFMKDKSREGIKIQKVFNKKIKTINDSINKLQKQIPVINKKRMSLLSSKVKQLKLELDADKLSQEAVMLILKYDVAEELERIIFHIESMKKELSLKKTKGKKVDFILQELFRETNTLAVKIDRPSLKGMALDMKLAVEEMREQAQNLE
ncbi:MAG: YicC family protein [SAR86 cluster bacterium]|uniref:YicC family protein n=1 Tax=SAR86 cluster bacterium TaxID=2030880 RepID=A0A520M9X8_9GAMM|nr:MAG: YicC family protein [SAR86 cluster bacterium]